MEVAKLVGATTAVAVASCTSAIELALLALGLPKGSRVAVSALKFCGAVQAVLSAGLEAVACDVDPRTYGLNLERLADWTERGGLHAVVSLDYGGLPTPLDEIADASGLAMECVVEDAAHTFGAATAAGPVGSIGSAVCFSFHATKNLPIGEGGLIATNDPTKASLLKMMRNHGINSDAWTRHSPTDRGEAWEYEAAVTGRKANMSDVHAAFLRDSSEDFSIGSSVGEKSWLPMTIASPCCRESPVPPRHQFEDHAWHLYAILLADRNRREDLIRRLRRSHIGSAIHYPPLASHASLRPHITHVDSCPIAENLAGRLLSLPLFPDMTQSELSA